MKIKTEKCGCRFMICSDIDETDTQQIEACCKEHDFM